MKKERLAQACSTLLTVDLSTYQSLMARPHLFRCPSYMLNSKEHTAVCMLSYAQARRTPQHCQTLLVKVSYDSRLWACWHCALAAGIKTSFLASLQER